MSDKTVHFRVCDFSEQIISSRYSEPATYSAVMHADGKVHQYRYALRPDFSPPITAIRSQAWLELLKQIMEAK